MESPVYCYYMEMEKKKIPNEFIVCLRVGAEGHGLERAVFCQRFLLIFNDEKCIFLRYLWSAINWEHISVRVAI